MDHVPTTGWDGRTSFNMDWKHLLCTWFCLHHFLFYCSWLVLINVSVESMTWSRELKSRQGWTRTHQFVHWWGNASVSHPQHIPLRVALTLSTLCVDRACLWVVESRSLLFRSWLTTWGRDTLNWVKVISLPLMQLVLWQLPVTMVLNAVYLQPKGVKNLRTQLSPIPNPFSLSFCQRRNSSDIRHWFELQVGESRWHRGWLWGLGSHDGRRGLR